MSRVRLHQMALLMAGLMLATGAVAGEEAKKPAPAPTGFYKKFFAPQMESKLGGDLDAAVEFVNRDANPWTRNDDTVMRVQRNAISAEASRRLRTDRANLYRRMRRLGIPVGDE